MRVIISGGGSGGHVFPAIAIANELRRRDGHIDILFIGAKGKLEMEKVPLAGYNIKGLWISGWHRKEKIRNILFPIKLMISLFNAYGILSKFKPDIVVGVGGFASGPVLAVATRINIPTLIQEQNSYPGKTNLLLSKKVDRICVAFPKMDRFFPNKKLRLTGNPVRLSLKRGNANKEEALGYFDLRTEIKTLLILGGSLGAKSLNKVVANYLQTRKIKDSIQVIWQIGKLYWDEYHHFEQEEIDVAARAFIDRMDLAYEAADLVVCRAGALTISELSFLGKAAILVPSPNVAEDHQSKNAQALAVHEAVKIINDKDLMEQFEEIVEGLIHDDVQLRKMETNIKKLGEPKAIELIVDEILKLVA